MPDWKGWLEGWPWKALLLGVIPVCLTVWGNAYMGRRAAKKIRKQDQEALRAALQQELTNHTSIIISIVLNIMADRPEKPGHTLFIKVIPFDNEVVYKANLQRLGLLDANQISHVMAAYHTQRFVWGKISSIADSGSGGEVLKVDHKQFQKLIPVLLGAQERILNAARSLGGDRPSQAYIASLQNQVDELNADFQMRSQSGD
jgi:hypothetical protein